MNDQRTFVSVQGREKLIQVFLFRSPLNTSWISSSSHKHTLYACAYTFFFLYIFSFSCFSKLLKYNRSQKCFLMLGYTANGLVIIHQARNCNCQKPSVKGVKFLGCSNIHSSCCRAYNLTPWKSMPICQAQRHWNQTRRFPEWRLVHNSMLHGFGFCNCNSSTNSLAI